MTDSNAADGTSNDGVDDALDDNHQYVTFDVDGELFAVPMGPVQEIIRMPEVAWLPLAPPTLDGLANLRGRVLPIVNLRRLLGCDKREHDDATRAIVINVGQPLGFIVDRVASVISVEPAQIESSSVIDSIVKAENLTGVIRRPRPEGGTDLLMILDFAGLIESEFAQLQKASAASALKGDASNLISQYAIEGEQGNDELRLVSFSVASQEYAIDINAVQEIVQVPEEITKIPNTNREVVGIISLRERLLPLVSLRALFHLPHEPLNDHHRIVVIALPNQMQVGLVTDSVKEVLSVPTHLAEDMPSILAKDHRMQELSSICRLDGGKRLVSIIATEQLLGLQSIQAAIQTGQTDSDPKHCGGTPMSDLQHDADITNADDDTQVVIFRLGAEEFGVPIMSVQEIVRVPEVLTRVPKTPDFVEGVINLRGTVLPVIDQRTRLGMGAIERNDRQRIMVYQIGGIRTGFIVDSVAEVLRIPKSQIAAAPELSPEQRKLISQVAKLNHDQRMVMLIDPNHLLIDEDAGQLNGWDHQSKSDSAPVQMAA